MGRFLIWASGADRKILAQCPSERAKFIGIGGAILTTAAMATIAAALTLRMVFAAHYGVAGAFGLLWGIAIFNLDRWLVSSSRRQDAWWKNVLVALPRLALAIIIGVVIAEPLVLRVFQPEIEAKAEQIRQEDVASQREELASQFSRLDDLKAEADEVSQTLNEDPEAAVLQENPEVQSLRDDVSELSDEVDALRSYAICVQENTCGPGAFGDSVQLDDRLAILNDKEAQLARAQAELDALEQQVIAANTDRVTEERSSLQTRLGNLNEEIARLQVEQAQADSRFGSLESSSFGLLARIEALNRLATESGDLAAAQWALRLFIMAIDCLPVFIKLMMSFGAPSAYERLLEATEDQIVARAETDAENEAKARAILASVVVDEAQARHDFEVAASEQLSREVVDAQVEIARVIIEAWKDQERLRAQEQVAAFVSAETD